MNSIETLLLNFEEVRRRSLKIWRTIPPGLFLWKPDDEAMTLLETVRHVLEGEWLYLQMIKSGGNLASNETPFNPRPFSDAEAEISFAAPYRKEFLEYVGVLTETDLKIKTINRADRGYVRNAGDFLLRMAYHEAVHAGQLLSSLRLAGAERPNIWD